MKFYVEALTRNGRPLLGNLDGQAVLHCRRPEQTKHVAALKLGRYENGNIVSRRAYEWRVETPSGNLVMKIPNPEYPK